MKIYVGTSGWLYSWNPNGFDWYINNSGLNSIELNASFYRFPFPSQVKGWTNKTKKYNPNLRWSIKVNRFITHIFKFSDRAFRTWKKFRKLFKPLDKNIDFFLFQLPPILTPKSSQTIEKFFKKTNLNERFALEVRNLTWFKKEWIEWAKGLGLTWVSVDAPDFTKFPREIYCTSKIVYLRMHGRYAWYSHYYTDTEMKEIKRKITRTKPKKVYVYFNNNTNMLENAQRFYKILTRRKLR
jgi:uncharacterized protein YecE (DUF72 family)